MKRTLADMLIVPTTSGVGSELPTAPSENPWIKK